MLDNKKTESLTQPSQYSRFPCHLVYLHNPHEKIAYECYDVGQKNAFPLRLLCSQMRMNMTGEGIVAVNLSVCIQ